MKGGGRPKARSGRADARAGGAEGSSGKPAGIDNGITGQEVGLTARALIEMWQAIKDQEVIVVVNPDDDTRLLRERVRDEPWMGLTESSLVQRGRILVMRPGLILKGPWL